MPVLLLSGQDDPVGDSGEGVQCVYQQMSKAGMKNVTLKQIANARHDVLHEEGEAAKLICSFVLENLQKG